MGALRAAGYRVTAGTLGRPYAIPRSDSHVRPWLSFDLPGLAEQEVIIVQHHPPEPSDTPTGREPMPTSEATVWAACNFGVIDSRPWAAGMAAKDVERTLAYGGVAICFCSPKVGPSKYVWARPYGNGVYVENKLELSTWDLISAVQHFDFPQLVGEEIQPTTGKGLFAPLTMHLQSAKFICTIQPPSWLSERFYPLARNKFGAAVGGLLVPEEKEQGIVILLPQVKDVAATLQVLLDDILPAVLPKLFPESEKFAWRERAPYQLPDAKRIHEDIAQLRAEADAKQRELEAQLEAVNRENGWLLDLLTETGEGLVDAVERALRELGLPDVKKVDEEKEAQEQGRLREDIQVLGGSPRILVEVKGLSGMPKEEDGLAAAKYRAARMEEWNRVDVRALTVINHQRGLPPLERDNEHVFQDDVLKNAPHERLALTTSFDLFRLVLNKRNLGWCAEDVCPLFYENGRVEVIPNHYEFVGAAFHYYEEIQVVAIDVETGGFALGDTLGFELPIGFIEEEVGSIHLDKDSVDRAEPGQQVGLKTSLDKQQARKGLRVYRVSRT